MPQNTCFVIMPIGTQSYDGTTLTAADLRRRYDDLIREALLAARPNLEITRADDVAVPGTITSDILTRVMHSDFVVADVSFPNPNVFYELGLRHACRAGTIIIRDSKGPKPPFDIAHLRHIEYENTPSGLKDLAQSFRQYFAHFERNPNKPDNQFLELAKLTHYPFPDFGAPEKEVAPELELMRVLIKSPELLNLALSGAQGQQIAPEQLFQAFAAQPDAAEQLFSALLRSGHVELPSATKPPRAIQQKRRKK